MFDINAFNKAAFLTKFNSQTEVLQKNERVTKTLLAELSRDVLDQLHTDEDVRPVNTLINILTPVNKKVAILFFRAFSGFKWDADNSKFTEKNKATYAKARAKAEDFLIDAANTLWTWAATEVQVEAKDFSLDTVRKNMESMLKKAAKNHFSNSQVLEAVLSAGFTAGDLATVMAKLADKVEAANAEAPQEQAA